jgi:hypothetical protein
VPFSINVDLSQLASSVSPEKLERLGEKAARDLTTLTRGKLIELAQSRLKTSQALFIENLSVIEEDNVFIISLHKDYSWINDGREPFNMIPGLLNGDKVKTNAQGHKYVVVPFKNTAGQTGPTQIHPEQRKMVTAIRGELKKQNISFAGIEKDDQGRPKLGRLHTLNLKTPKKNQEGPYQGQGAIGQPRQGHSFASPANQQLLGGAAVYQHEVANKKTGKMEVKRSVITFRTASETQLGTGMWDHPGNQRTGIFEDGYEWALNELNTNVIPELIKNMQND